MKGLLTILTLALTLTAFGQKSRIGFKLLPGLADVHEQFEKQNFQNTLRPRFTFNFGGQYILQLKDSLIFVETGIYYTDRGNVQKDFIIQYYYLGGDSTTTSDIYYHHYYISIPILFRLEIKNLYASIGPTFDYYLKTKRVWTPEEDKVEKGGLRRSFFKNVKLGVDLNIGGQFRLTDHLGLFIEGSFHPSRFAEDKINKEWFYFLTYEFGTGLNFKL